MNDLAQRRVFNFHFHGKVWYKNVSFDGMEPFLLTVPGCDSTCPLERFLELTRPVVSDDVRAECSLSQPLYPARLNGFDITGNGYRVFLGTVPFNEFSFCTDVDVS